MRQKRHSNKAIERMRHQLQMTSAELLERIHEYPVCPVNRQLAVRRGYDLRGPLEEKALDLIPGAKWTAFVNVNHTLVHLIPAEADFHVRIPLYRSLKSANDAYLHRVILAKFWRE